MHNIKACLLGGNTTAKVEAEVGLEISQSK